MAEKFTDSSSRSGEPVADGISSIAEPTATGAPTSRKMNVAANLVAMNPTWAITRKNTNHPVELTILDEDGDLTLYVGADTAEPERAFRVCSSTLRRASPVWKKMLFGPWVEAKPSTGEWTVSFPEDKPSPLSVLLGIIHGKFDFLIPTWRIASRDFATISDVLVVADKYDLFDCLRPWAADWLGPVDSDAELTDHEVLQRMHVAWEFGAEQKLTSIITTLIFATSDANIQGLLEFSEQYHLHSLPSVLGDFLVTVAESRLRVIQEILDFFHEQVDRRAQQTERACKKYTSSSHTRRMCDSLILGEVTRYLVAERVTVPKCVGEIGESANKVLQDLEMIFDISHACMRGHKLCSPLVDFKSFEQMLIALWDEWEDVLGNGPRMRMYKRRRQLNIEEDV